MFPIRFDSIYQERVWGGRELENVYGRQLPDAETPYGESWEISDREEAQSVVCDDNEYAGMTLNALWSEQETREKIFGEGLTGERFPLLVKILDCRENLSVQVHPPEEQEGEPKTEVWYIAAADAGAKLYAGMKPDVSKESFEQAILEGTVADKIHALEAKAGESIFIPSGRLHAIGAGYLIYEIQQNSDTTYRVFDWNRHGLDGKPRELHVDESMRCIDFSDVEPCVEPPETAVIADCAHFKVEKFCISSGEELGNPDPERFSILTVVEGQLQDKAENVYQAGDFMILPRKAKSLIVAADALILQTTIPAE